MSSTMKKLQVNDIENLSLNTLIEAYKNGYEIESTFNTHDVNSAPIMSMSKDCQVSTKTVGQVVTLKSTPSGGTSPYTVNIKKDGTVIKQFTGVASGTTVTHQYTLTSSDVGTRTFSTIAYDSCPGAPKATPEESCSLNVTSSQTCTAGTVAFTLS